MYVQPKPVTSEPKPRKNTIIVVMLQIGTTALSHKIYVLITKLSMNLNGEVCPHLLGQSAAR